MATEKNASKASIHKRREEQRDQLEEAIVSLSQRMQTLDATQKKLNLLESVSLGLYEELDKLAKKAGAEEVTELVLQQVNDVIREAKELLSEDTYVQRYSEFVPAGNNPQHRDVVIVLRQIRQGLERFTSALGSASSHCSSLLSDARGVRVAVLFALQGIEHVSKGDIENNEVNVSTRWLAGYPEYFAFDVLDRTNIPSYFSAE